MEHIHGSYESTNNFRINPFSRAIINESEIDIVITQYDHNSERFIFELPKIVEEHDMTLCSSIRVHYINAGSNGKINRGVYEVTDITVNEDDESLVKFSWLLSRNVTSLEGVLTFAIQFVCTTDGEVDYSWGTTPYKQIKVSETYDNSEDIIVEDYSDILEQWKEELFAQFMEDGIDLTGYYSKPEVDELLGSKANTEHEHNTAIYGFVPVALTKLDNDGLISLTGDEYEITDNSIARTGLNEVSAFINYKGRVSLEWSASSTTQLYIDYVPIQGYSYRGEVSTNIEIFLSGLGDSITFKKFECHVDEPGFMSGEHIEKLNKAYDAHTTNALKASASGEVIRVDDVSFVEHKASVKVSSKNLLPYPYHMATNSGSGGTFTVQDDGGIVLGGTPTDYIHILLYSGVCLNKNNLITISVGGEITNAVVDFAIIDSANNILTSVSTKTSTGNSVTINTKNYPAAAKWTLALKREYNNIEMTGVAYPKIEIGNTATEYTPYVDPATVTVTRYGKNLFPTLSKTSKDGITLTKIDDYYVLDGRATSSGLITTTTSLPGGTYTLSVNNPVHNNLDLAIVQIYSDTTKNSVVAKDNTSYSAYTAEISASNDYQFRIRYENGVTYNNYIIKPQLELGTESTDYIAYSGRTTYTPDSDGTLEIDAIAPTMTVFTDKPGAIVDVEYQHDHNKAMDDVRADVKTLDNSVAELAVTVGDFDAALDAAIALCDHYIGGGS